MNKKVRLTLYIILIVLVVPTFYSIFNVGNPNSLFRFIVKDPAYDMLVTLFFGICMGAIAIILTFQSKRENSLEHILDLNQEHIRFLRSKGNTDEQIAKEFLGKLEIKKTGALSKLAYRRVLRYLAKME